jgi:RNA polymerase sigma-70 factor (ECF subfamily)
VPPEHPTPADAGLGEPAEGDGADGRRAAPRSVPIADEEASLLARLRAGDDRAYEQLVRSNTPRLLAVARRITPSETDAEDAVQEAFLQAFRSIGGFDGRSALSTWLHRIVVNVALSRLRRAGSRRERPLDELLPEFAGGRHAASPRPWRALPHDGGTDTELRDAVRRAIADLPEEFRAVLLLKDVGGMQSAEIAASLGISDALVRQRVHRARLALMKSLAPTLEEERR